MIIHVVKSGETLYLLSEVYKVPVARINAVNQLPDPSKLLVGQALLIPTEDTVYIVKPGDTLYSIARRYGVSAAVLAQYNNIATPGYIQPGRILLIPAQRYVVRRGDTLYAIARRFGVTAADLAAVNRITDPGTIYAGTTLVIPRSRRPLTYVNAFIYILGEMAVPIVREDGPFLTYLSPFAYRVRADGSLETIDDGPAIEEGLARRDVPMMAINNFSSQELGQDVAHSVLTDTAAGNRLLDNVVTVMRTNGYRGLNVDFENVLPADRLAYNAFLLRAAARMHGNGWFISTSLAPKYSGTQTGLLYEAHDYPAHGRIADWVVLMTYEWGARKGPPQAISPINQIRRVLDYAVTVIPRDKIMLGFQIYARDWVIPFVPGSEAETISPQEAVRRATEHNSAIGFDTAAASPYFHYTDTAGKKHEVWFEDARSAQAKFDLVKSYRLRGVSYWALGYPYPQNWELLRDNFDIIKLLPG